MGFGAGFGQGFATSFERETSRIEDRKNDNFKLMYNTYLDKVKKREEEESKDKVYVNYAKSLTEGREDLPKDAFVKVYEWKKSGLSDDEIDRRINDISGWKAYEEPNPSATPQPQPGPYNNPTMQDSMNAPNSSPINPRTPASNPAPGSERESTAAASVDVASNDPSTGLPPLTGERSVLDKILGRDSREARDFNDSIDRIAKITGVDRQTILDTMAKGYESQAVTAEMRSQAPTYTRTGVDTPVPSLKDAYAQEKRAEAIFNQRPNDPNAKKAWEQAKLQRESAERAIKRGSELENGGGYGSDAMNKFVFNDVINPMAEEADVMNRRMNTAKTVISGFASMDRIIEQEPAVQAELVTYFATQADKLKKNADEVLNLLDSGNTGAIAKQADVLKQQEQEYEQSFNRVRDIATAKKLLDVKSQLLAYQIGMLYGQKDRSLSETERKMFQDMVDSTTSLEKFRRTAAALAAGEIERIDFDAKTLSEKQSVMKENFKKTFDKELMIDPYNKTFETEVLNNGDPRIKDAYKRMKSYVGYGFKEEGNVETPVTPTPSVVKRSEVDSVPFLSEEEFNSAPPGTKYRIPGRPTEVFVK